MREERERQKKGESKNLQEKRKRELLHNYITEQSNKQDMDKVDTQKVSGKHVRSDIVNTLLYSILL